MTNRPIRSEYEANMAFQRAIPTWQKPAPVRTEAQKVVIAKAVKAFFRIF